jgi:hypothetical protein
MFEDGDVVKYRELPISVLGIIVFFKNSSPRVRFIDDSLHMHLDIIYPTIRELRFKWEMV